MYANKDVARYVGLSANRPRVINLRRSLSHSLLLKVLCAYHIASGVLAQF